MTKTNSPQAYLLSIVVAAAVIFGVLFCFNTEAKAIDDEYAFFKTLTTTELVEKFVNEKESDAKLAAVVQMIDRKELELTVPVFIKALMINDDLMRSAATTALKDLNEKAVPFLEPLFESKELRDYFAGCEGIRAIGSAAREYLPQAAVGLKSDSRGPKMAALFALSPMKKYALPYLERVIELLDDKDMNVRLWACRVLLSLEKDAAPAAPRIIKLLEEGITSDRGFACLVLGSIGISEDYDVVELLSARLEAFSQPEKERALMGLASLGPKAIAAKEKVQALMQDKTKNCVVAAAVTFWKLTGESDEPVQALVSTLDDHAYRPDAVRALAQFGTNAEPAIQKLMDGLDTDDEAFREEIVITLGELGAIAKPAMQKLRTIMKSDPDRLIRLEAGRAIEKIKAANQ